MTDKAKDTSLSPGRPVVSATKKRQMRADIAQIAKRLFQDEGYAKISMRRIASEMGCSPMTLYKYYDAKVDILRTLWTNVFIELFDQLDAATLPSDDKLQSLGLAYVRYWLDHPDYYRLVFISDGVTQSDVSVFIDNPILAQRYAIFANALTDLGASELPPEDVKIKLDAFLCFLNGIAHNMITISGYGWSDPVVLVDIAVRAIKA